MKCFGVLPMLLACILISATATSAFLRGELRNFWRAINPPKPPKWYGEHFRPEPAIRPFGYPHRHQPNPSITSDIGINLPEPEQPQHNPARTSTSTTSTTTTTTTTTTPRPETPAPSRRRFNIPSRPAFPAFPRRGNTDSDGGRNSEFADKPGYCPGKPTGPWTCSSRCALDSDCRGERKCCKNRCGAFACVAPEKQFVEDSNVDIRR